MFFGTSHLPSHKGSFYLNRDFSSTWKPKAAAQESAPHRARAGKWGEVTLPRICYRESRSKIQHRKGSPDFLKVSLLCLARTGGGRALLCSPILLEGPISTVLPKALCLSLTHPCNGHSLVLSLLCLHDWDHVCWMPDLWSCMPWWGHGCTKWLSPGWAHSCSVMEHWGESKRVHRIQVNTGGLPYHLLKYRNSQQESTCSSECHRETPYMLCGNEWKVAHLTPLPLFWKSRPELPTAMLGIKEK